MADRRIVLGLIAAFVFAACSGGPSATFTPPAGATATPAITPAPTTPPTAQTTPTDAPPTGTPLPSPDAADIAAWAADICAINATFLADNQQITTDIPEPAERTLDALKQVNADRQPLVEQAYGDAVDALDALTPWPGGEEFRLALLDEFQSALDAMPEFFQAIADATTVEDIDTQYANRATISGAGLLGSAQSVVEIDVAFSDAVAAITTGCRFFEFDARARVHGIETPDFSELVIDELFEESGDWTPAGDFDGGSATIIAGSLTFSFDAATTHVEDTAGLTEPVFHDVRIESHFSMNGSSLAGLSCRGSRNARYYVLVNTLGLILIYRTDAQLLGRRAVPDGFDSSQGIDLAIECIAGNSDPFSLIVYLNGERVAEVQEQQAIQSEGTGGMVTQALAPGAGAIFDDFRVLVPAD